MTRRYMWVQKARRPRSVTGNRLADFHRMHQLNERMGKAIQVDLLKGIRSFRQSLKPGALERAIQKGNVKRLIETIPWGKLPGHLKDFGDRVADAASTAGKSTIAALPKPVRQDLRYDINNPRMEAYVGGRTGELMKTIKEGGLEATRLAVRRAVTEARTPQQVADEIRDSIGLNARQAGALSNYRRSLETSDEPMSQGRIDVLVDDYQERLLDQRAIMVGRTEVRFATNEGQQDVWEAAQDDGLLPETVKRVWVVDGDPCPQICLPMDGVAVGLDEPWVLPDGREVDNPTQAHPNCYCISSLSFD